MCQKPGLCSAAAKRMPFFVRLHKHWQVEMQKERYRHFSFKMVNYFHIPLQAQISAPLFCKMFSLCFELFQ